MTASEFLRTTTGSWLSHARSGDWARTALAVGGASGAACLTLDLLNAGQVLQTSVVATVAGWTAYAAYEHGTDSQERPDGPLEAPSQRKQVDRAFVPLSRTRR